MVASVDVESLAVSLKETAVPEGVAPPEIDDGEAALSREINLRRAQVEDAEVLRRARAL